MVRFAVGVEGGGWYVRSVFGLIFCRDFHTLVVERESLSLAGREDVISWRGVSACSYLQSCQTLHGPIFLAGVCVGSGGGMRRGGESLFGRESSFLRVSGLRDCRKCTVSMCRFTTWDEDCCHQK